MADEGKTTVLWISEQPTRPTGYGTVTREYVKRLADSCNVFVMAWDHHGEDIQHSEGWTMVHGGSNFGADLLNHKGTATITDYQINRLRPDVVVSLTDIWNTAAIVRACNRAGVPHISHIPIDGYPINRKFDELLGMTHTPLFMSEFGAEEMNKMVKRLHSTKGKAPESHRNPVIDRYETEDIHFLHHGVDTTVFAPVTDEEKADMRSKLGLPWDTVFLSVGRNGNRKQIPRLLQAFKGMLGRVPNPASIGLILHTGDPTDSHRLGGWDLPAMVEDMGLQANITFSDTSASPVMGLDKRQMARLYQISDFHVSATGGEGFGIPSLEAMACGLPIILPDNSTGPELIGGERGWLVDNATTIIGPSHGNTMTLVDIDALSDALLDAVEIDETTFRAMRTACIEYGDLHDYAINANHMLDLIIEVRGTAHPQGNRGAIDND